DRRALSLAAVAVALVAYGAVFYLVRLSLFPTGDEPHYLAITDTLVHRRTLDLRATYADPRLRAFLPIGPEETHGFVYRPGGPLISIHSVGLPVYVAGPYLLGERIGRALGQLPIKSGYYGAVAAMVLASVLGAAAAFRFALEVAGRPWPAAVAWALV